VTNPEIIKRHREPLDEGRAQSISRRSGCLNCRKKTLLQETRAWSKQTASNQRRTHTMIIDKLSRKSLLGCEFEGP
jgi:hypothetical protein